MLKVAQTTSRHAPTVGPLVAKTNVLYLPMSGSSELILNPRDLNPISRWMTVSPEKIIDWMKGRGITPLSSGLVLFDFELYSKLKGLVPFHQTLSVYQEVYDAAKQYAPNMQIGFFGPPGVKADGDYQSDEFWSEFFAIPDALYVQNFVKVRTSNIPLPGWLLERTLHKCSMAAASGLPWWSVLSFVNHVLGHRGARVYVTEEVQNTLVRSIAVEKFDNQQGFLQWGWGANDEHLASLIEVIKENV